MKNYRILRTFHGSQTGLDFHVFKANTERRLSDHLAETVLREGWVELAEAPAPAPAHARETKIIAPESRTPVPESHDPVPESHTPAPETAIPQKTKLKLNRKS